MKRLTKHILSLLRLYDSVALPETGVYFVRYIPATFTEDFSTLLPPRYEVGFISAEEEIDRQDDTGLLDSYTRRETGGNREEARALLEQDLTDFRNYLSYGGEPVLKDFKLMQINLPEVDLREAAYQTANAFPEDEAEEEVYTEYPNEDEEEAARERSFNPSYYYIPIHKKLANVAACLLLVVAVGFTAMLPIDKAGNNSSTASIIPISLSEENRDSKAMKEILKPLAEEPSKSEKPEMAKGFPTAAEVENSTAAEISKVSKANPDTPMTVVAQARDKFYAIVAAFKSEKEAAKFIKGCKGDKGRFGIIKTKSFYMISASSATEQSALESRLPLIRSEFPDAWVYTLK